MTLPVVDVTNSTTAKNSSGTSVVISMPSGAAVGNLLLFFGSFTVFTSTPTASLPVGWNLETSVAWNSTSASFSYCASRIVDGSEGASFTFDVTTAGSKIGGLAELVLITGNAASSFVDVLATVTTTSGTTGTFPTVTTTGADRVVVGYGFTGVGPGSGSQFNTLVPTGTTLIKSNNDSTFSANAAAYFNQVSAGATGAKSVATVTLATNKVWHGITVAIAPPASTSGTVAATEAKDTAAVAGDISSGSLAATEAKDVTSLAGIVASVGSLAATEAQDTASFIGGSVITGSLTVTEGADVAGFIGVVASVGTLSATETKDAASFAGSVVTAGTLAASDTRDTAALAGAIASVGTISATEMPDVAAITGALAVSGTLAATEPRDTAAFIGASISGTLTASETLDSGLFVGITIQPGGTYPLAIEGGGTVIKSRLSGGGSVVAGSIPSTGRVVLGSLRGRP